MNSFPRLLHLLRKENNLSQKQLAADLGISQALLSHYEKGIRECGLDFVVQVADYFHVSCDYLLGRTPLQNGILPAEPEPSPRPTRKKGAQTQLPRKLIGNTLHIIFGILQQTGDQKLTAQVTACVNIVLYRIFRILFSANSKNASAFFALSAQDYASLSLSGFCREEVRLKRLLSDADKTASKPTVPLITTDTLTEDFPLYASSLLDMIQSVEGTLTLPEDTQGNFPEK